MICLLKPMHRGIKQILIFVKQSPISNFAKVLAKKKVQRHLQRQSLKIKISTFLMYTFQYKFP